MITWKLEVEDGKCRPSGSPPRDTSLAAFADLRAGGNGATCAFPQHAEDCKCVLQLLLVYCKNVVVWSQCST